MLEGLFLIAQSEAASGAAGEVAGGVSLTATNAALLAGYASLLLAGLGGSLHCIGMCGPILIGFSQSFARSNEPPPTEANPDRDAAVSAGDGPLPGDRRPSLMWDFAAYHTGRIWTYALLGLIAGFVGHGLRESSTWMGWQRGAGVAIGVFVVITGLALLGVIPGVDADRWLHRCGFKKFGKGSWFRGLMQSRGFTPKLLLGVVMGFLPCGLVYAALVLAATMPSPLHSALAMAVFGIGTLPSLSAVLIFARAVPASWRVHGTKLAAVVIIATGAWMSYRAYTVGEAGHCPACHSKQASAATR